MAVNVKSIFLSVKHALGASAQATRSYVVNIGSVSSFVGQAATPAYKASKGRRAATDRVRSPWTTPPTDCGANCICPGITDTPMLRFHLSKTPDPEAALAERLRRVPLGVAIAAARRRQGRAISGVRRFLGHHGHFAGRRRRIPGRRRMETRIAHAIHGARMTRSPCNSNWPAPISRFPLLDHDDVLDLIAHARSSTASTSACSRAARTCGRRASSRTWTGRHASWRPSSAIAACRRPTSFCRPRPISFRWRRIIPTPDRRRKARDLFLRTLDFAGGCGSRHVSALPGVHFADEPAARRLARACDELAWRVEQAAGRRLVFSVEAHVGSIAPRPESRAGTGAARRPGLTLTLDYTHFTQVGHRRRRRSSRWSPHASHFHARGACKGRLQASLQAQHDRLRPRAARPCSHATIRATSASNTCGSTGSTATRSTICRKRFCCAIFSAHRVAMPDVTIAAQARPVELQTARQTPPGQRL